VKAPGLGTEVLEREIFYAIERHTRARAIQALVRDSLTHHSVLLAPHVAALEGALRSVASYLMRNHPVAYEHFDVAMREHRAGLALEELKKLELPAPKHRPEAQPCLDEVIRLNLELTATRERLVTQTASSRMLVGTLLGMLLFFALIFLTGD
jgi:hypothetical protein